MYTILYETSRQSRFDAQYWMLGAGALGQPRGMVWEGRGRGGGFRMDFLKNNDSTSNLYVSLEFKKHVT